MKQDKSSIICNDIVNHFKGHRIGVTVEERMFGTWRHKGEFHDVEIVALEVQNNGT